jgi:hypothetical protein
MGEFLDALRLEQAKRPQANKSENRLREFLGDAGWKDFEKACKDPSINNAVIHRVLKGKGCLLSYSAIARVRAEIAAT